MSLKRIIARNASWSAAGMATSVVTGFVTAPFLVHRLGDTTYGLWILIALMTSYFNLIDLGLRASITRYVAFYRARNEPAQVNAILSTAQLLLLGAAAVTLLASIILVVVFPHWFAVPPGQISEVRLAVFISGLTIACTLALGSYDAMLFACERFDIINIIEMVCDIADTIVLFYLISRGGSLVTVSAVVLAGCLARDLAKAVACFRLDRRLRIGPVGASKDVARTLFSFGFWRFAWSVGGRITSQSGPIIIGNRLGAISATPYGIGARLVGYARTISTVGTGILTPTATALHADDQHERQKTLFIEGGRFCLALSLFFALCLWFLGESFITLWMNRPLAGAALVATILALGEVLPMSQWVTNSILLGRNRHRVIAYASFIEMILVIGIGFGVARQFGLTGVCLAIAINGTIFRGAVPAIYACRVLDIPLWLYLKQVVFPPVVAAIIPAVGLALLVQWHAPHKWLELFLFGGAFSIAYFIACGAAMVAVMGYQHVYRHYVLPLQCLLRRRSTLRWYGIVSNDQHLSADQIAQMQREKLADLVRHCNEHVPYYKNLFRERGIDPGCVEDISILRDAGIQLDKAGLKSAGDLLFSDIRPRSRFYKISTSGSTGAPTTFWKSIDTVGRRQAMKYRAEEWIGKPIGTRTTLVWGRMPTRKPHIRLLRYLFWRYQNYQFLSAFELGPDELANHLARMNRFGTEFIESYVTAVYQMAKVMAARKLPPPPKLRGILVGGEQLIDEQRELIESSFGCPVYNRYGSSEFSNIASECSHRRGLHIHSDQFIVEVVDENDRPVIDQVGEIVVTDLHSHDMPLIRYHIGDRGVMSSETCPCGRALPMLRSINGRTSQRVLTRSGRVIHDFYFIHSLSPIPGISKFQVIQKTLDLVHVNLELDKTVPGEQVVTSLRGRLENLGEYGISVAFNVVDSIPLTSAGKLRHFVSELAAS